MESLINNIIKNQTLCIFVSPHLDDAFFSAGELMMRLSGKTDVVVINAMTGVGDGKSSLSAKAFLRQIGEKSAIDLEKKRAVEDAKAMSLVGAKVINLGITDALWRMRRTRTIRSAISSLVPEFGLLYPTYKFHIKKGIVNKEDFAEREIIKGVVSFLDGRQNFYLFCPAAFGKHVDHVAVRNACLKAFGEKTILWADIPYFQNEKMSNEILKKDNYSILHLPVLTNKKFLIAQTYKTQFKAVIADKRMFFNSEIFFHKKKKPMSPRSKIFRSIDKHLYHEWRLLWEKAEEKNIFNHPSWFKSSLKAFNTKKFVVVACYKERELVGILPMVEGVKFGTKLFLNPGGLYFDKASLLVKSSSSNEIFNSMFKELMHVKSFFLNEISVKTALHLINGSLPFSINKASISPFTQAIPSSGLYSGDRRRKLKNILNKNPDIHLVITDSISNKIEIIKKIEENSSKIKEHKDIFSDKELVKFCKTLGKESNGALKVAILYKNKKPICYRYGYITNNVYHDANTAFMTGYSNLQPGKLSMYLLAQELLKAGVESFDLSRGDTQFKKELTPHFRTQFSVSYFSEKNQRSKFGILTKFIELLEKNLILYNAARNTKYALSSILAI